MTIDDHKKVIEAALRIFEDVEGKAPNMRLEFFEYNEEQRCWYVGLSRASGKGVFSARIHYKVEVETGLDSKYDLAPYARKVEKCE